MPPRPSPPPPAAIRAARRSARLTQTQAGRIVSVTQSTWKRWEAGRHPMPPASFNLFQILTDPNSAISTLMPGGRRP
ncbi:helix-turn-helix domain-containing protein [Gluconacetobacter sp. 1b LMG 1731]|uniref:Helix-turn-helix domain-containing protein n=1 Tax=Gluconacetobacter dulcium TaxID=2729096 RepID=A0A7W4NSI0_9PROT|nr:helix-turn-helix domain-containing protein [Gluconacetobacter dulcium]MBB2193817.1 helix-turn-helix domain-containing protein [Gluconacetobacter dulcium]